MTMESTSLKRVKRKIKTSQNPLFEKWLKEWRDEAAKNGSEMRHCFNRALKSLQKFPVRLSSGKECAILENFGAKICKMLDDRLERYKALHPQDKSLTDKNETEKMDLIIEKNAEVKKRNSENCEDSPQKKKRISKEAESHDGNNKTSSYVPTYRSGAYAILVTLYEKMQEEDFKGYMTKSDIQTQAQILCDASFTRPLPGSHFTAWSSMGVLIKKKLVNKEGNPAKFTLTDEGISLAVKLKDDHKVRKEVFQVETCSAEPSPPAAIEQESGDPKTLIAPLVDEILSQDIEPEYPPEDNESIFMLPESFEIILLVDTQERDDKFQHGSEMAVQMLKSRRVNFEIRHLKVGDFLWIARDRSGHELVLPYIVERKRMDDLASSIKDGRFHEQKFRLKQSGVENLIYLVEKYGYENQRLGLPLPTLLQAISNTQITGGFTVKVTSNHDHSMRYMSCLTIQLTELFKMKTLMSCKKSDLSPVGLSEDLIPLMTFREFNKGSEKNKKPTVRNMLLKHLLQLNGVSVEKAKAIVDLYPTPKALMEGMKKPSGEKSIAELTFGGYNRAIGPTTAKHIHLLYTSLEIL